MGTANDEKTKKGMIRMVRQGVKAKVPFTVLIGHPSNLDFMREVVNEANVDEEIEVFTDSNIEKGRYWSYQRHNFERDYPDRSKVRSKEHPEEADKLSTSERVQQLLAELGECFAELETRVKELERRDG